MSTKADMAGLWLNRSIAAPAIVQPRWSSWRIGRGFRMGACAACLLMWGRPAASESNRSKELRACTTAYENARQLEQAGHLRQARDSLPACAKAICGSELQAMCLALYGRIDSDIPSVVPVVTDEDVPVEAQVTIDGTLLTSNPDGRAFSIDPGLHHFSFTTAGGVVAVRAVMIAQGERNRLIEVPLHSQAELHAKAALSKPLPEEPEPQEAAPDTTKRVPEPPKSRPEAPPSDAPSPEPGSLDKEPSGGASAVPYLLGGVTLVGVGGYALLTSWGRADNKLMAACAPDCSPSSVDHIQRLYVAADVSLAVGIVGAVGLVGWAAFHRSNEKPPNHSAYVVDVEPTPSGAFARVSGSF
jgi:hypothetical protein